MIVDFPPPGYYYHGGTQVLIDSEGSGSIVVNPTIVESRLFGSSGATIANHGLHKYRQCLEACFEDFQLREYLENTHLNVNNSHDTISRDSSRENFPEWFLERR